LTIGSLTPFFNFNKTNNTAAGGWSSGPITLTVTAKKNNVAALNSQTLIFTASGQLLTTGSGATTVTSVSPNYNTASFVFNFGDGSTLTLSQFGRSNATGFIGNVGSSDGIFGFNSSSEFVPNVAPEPGSMALVATGLMSTLGMVAVRRRKAA